MWWKILLFLLIIVGFNFHSDEVRVIDGDTISVGSEKIRLAEIDAPELSQAYGLQAKRFLATLVEGKSVTVKSKGTDLYGRTIAYVYVDGQDVSELMVRQGLAWAYKSAKMRKLEHIARTNKLGLWKDVNPIKPSEYRKARSKG